MKYQTKPGLVKGWAVVVIVVAIISIGGGVYLLTQSDDEAGTQTAEQTEIATNTDTADQSDIDQPSELEQSFAVYQNALEANAKVRCDYTGADGYKGTAYVDSATRTRVDGTAAEGEQASFIRNGDTYYGWVEGETNGFRFTASADQDLPENYQTFSDDSFEAADEQAGVSVDCREDSFSDDLFTPPNDVNFQGFGDFQIPS